MTDDEFNTLLPELCYTKVFGAEPGKRIGIIKRGESGYYLTDFDTPKASDAIVQEAVDNFNKRLGVTPAQVEAMEAGSIFRWDCPAADPRSYDAAGNHKAGKAARA